jgi:hypothetical protein
LPVKIVLACIALGALPALADERLVELPPVLYTTVQHDMPAAVRHALEDEVEDIMGPLGRHFIWRSLEGVRGNEMSSELAVLTFKGHCDVEGLVLKETHPGALGWTHVSDGAILPFSDIDCDRIRSFVQKELLYRKQTEREDVFGRAIARVVAHELYHIFAQTNHHGSDGVAKSAYTVTELLGDEFHFMQREEQVMRSKAPQQPTRLPSL